MEKFVLLGVGNVAMNVVKLLDKSSTIYGTTRSADRIASLKSAGITPIQLGTGSLADKLPVEILKNANVLVSFPPDGTTDASCSQQCARARRIVYISSTGVYGQLSGRVNEVSPVDETNANARARLAAENCWRQMGAVVLRCPGLYGPESGLHLRLPTGTVKIPGDGKNFVSRIHLGDLARIILAIFEKGTKESLYVIGDMHPSSHLDTISYVCQKLNLALPGFAELSQVNETLRGNRKIDSSRLRTELDLELLYPSYREGYDSILSDLLHQQI